jgi:hypothetical protein
MKYMWRGNVDWILLIRNSPLEWFCESKNELRATFSNDVMACSLLKLCRLFGRKQWLHLHGRKISLTSNKVINLLVSYKADIFWLAKGLLTFQDGVCCSALRKRVFKMNSAFTILCGEQHKWRNETTLYAVVSVRVLTIVPWILHL